MIIASIAMEELALSHIVNAEGEKLQYVLGTLPKGPRLCANTQEILAVNKSVKDLLDTVMQSQLLLKGKLEKTLEASGQGGPPPAPPAPCGPVCPGRPPCGCGGPCGQKSAIQLVSRGSGFSWGNGCPMSWKRRGQQGCGIRWDEKTPSLVRLDPAKTYTLDLAVNVCGSFPGDSTGTICFQLTPCNAFLDILPLHFYVKCLECKPLTLHYSATLFPQACPPSDAGLSLLLQYKDSLFVEQASLSIVEI